MKLVNKLNFVTGTGEWAAYEANIAFGCPNGCLYCYSRYNAVTRFKRTDVVGWRKQKVMSDGVKEFGCKKYDGPIMFPTRHDIVEGECLETAMVFLANLLYSGNEILVVTKPRYDCIYSMVNMFGAFKDKLHFRFTIGSCEDATIKLFEPFASGFSERLRCLRLAFDSGFRTSVSSEPMLAGRLGAIKVFNATKDYVTDGVWIGPMNKIDSRIPLVDFEKLYPAEVEILPRTAIVNGIHALQSRDTLMDLYEELKNEPNVRWKNEIKKIVGLPLNDKPGKDK